MATGLDIKVNYVDFRNASGEITQVDDRARLGVSIPAEDLMTLNVSAFNGNGDGVKQVGETPRPLLSILTYTPITGSADLLFTDRNGQASKTNLTLHEFYAIILPPDGQMASNYQLTLGGTTYHGVLHVENPRPGSSHSMIVGISPIP